ncbi:alpha/beta fold hydrolase [Lysinibacillus fusiformis]|uniref:alpha/beta fold hydrolase n=1 Tax=Lysinibacillus fusiformis TaxID=28031 RepID=UPI0021C07B17|nr:alpha/beta hydrolase [Lysinibacillus fusiformis]UXJ67282.1 alpha/beta hydrolase [Lysinibacillus fusiformis]
MQYKEYGHFDGPVMMFLHGGGVGGWMWEQQIQHFSNYHCIVPELVSDHSFSIEQCAQHLIQLLEEKANGKLIIVIGFSLGAQIAIQMLSIKPNLIHFSIINSALVIPSPTTAWMIRPFLRLSFPLIKNKTFAKLQAKTLYIDNRYFDRYYHDSSKMTYDALIQVLQENMTFSIPRNFHNAQGHILITVGNQEKKIMKKSAQVLVQSHPNAKGILLNNIGHGVSLAQPAFFNRFVENWIKEGQLPVGTVIQ